MSALGAPNLPAAVNEPVRSYAPGSPERPKIEAELKRQASTEHDLPLWIGGKQVRTGNTQPLAVPHDHGASLGVWHEGGESEARAAIDAAEAAKADWAALPFEDRAAVFLRAAALLQDRHRDRLNASTMLNQSKTVHQAEIDAACELIDFFKFNVEYLQDIYSEQPQSSPGIYNRLEYRPLDGFVFAVTPFNFTSIAVNLAAAPALCGNTVIWKPAPTAMLGAHYAMELLDEAGLPPGVINLVGGPPAQVGAPIMQDPRLAGVHFTGSTATFKLLWKQVAEGLDSYRAYPRVVGETGGKDFIFAHASANPDELLTAMVRGAFEYQGQKCSAVSRVYMPASLWKDLEPRLAATMAELRMGDPRDFGNFMGAVIDERAFTKHESAIGQAKQDSGVSKVIGGECDRTKGWFVRPTAIVCEDPNYRTMREELFGPIMSIHVYDDATYTETLALCAGTSPYALTGAIFGRDRHAVAQAVQALRGAAGNFYINDKPTGAVVGQQPFGGSKASGTNDKAGSKLNLLRWLSPRTIKENLAPPTDYRYPFMAS